MPERVRITDVAPRDGLQNEPHNIPTEHKLRLLKLLLDARVDEIEATSFVSPKWIPQLADAPELLRRFADCDARDVIISALVPNERGMQAVLDVNRSVGRRLIEKVAVFTAASEAFAQRNTNATIAETLERFVPVIAMAHDADIAVRGYVSCAIACPLAGVVAPQAAADVARRLLEIGVDELDLADTIGAATPRSVTELLESTRNVCGADAVRNVTIHLHDTFGRAADCVRAALAMGVRSFDGAAGGLGGCPYASTADRRAPGNIATRALVAAIHAAGFETRVDLEALAAAEAFAQSLARSLPDGTGPAGRK
ncbi:MAG: hydroxymethylglutaryl-CoA lyase [Planctomycetota bacterium]|nr:MAG: hydroxymethylglutaryl-CoA lyase [Planctomycetota bacterium]